MSRESVPEETQEERDGETEPEWQGEDGKGGGGGYCPETTAEREKRGREQKSDSLTAAPNGFSGERERRGKEEKA